MKISPHKTKDRLDFIAVAVLLLLCLSWGLQQVTIKIANEGVSPVYQASIRSICSTILLWLWMGFKKEPLFRKDGTFFWGVAAGLLFSFEFLLLYRGLDYTSASRAVIFFYLSPFVVAIGSQLFLPGEKLSYLQTAGLLCAFIGILIAFGESFSISAHTMLMGDGMIVIAAIFWGATTVLIKAGPLVKISSAKILFYQIAVSAIVLPISAWLMNEPGITAMTPLIGFCIAYQSVWVAFITYLLWFWLIRNYPVSRISAFTFFTPLFGVIAGGVLLDEKLTGWLMMALFFVCIGVYMVNRPSASRL